MGLHHPSDAGHFEDCCISVNALRNRKSDFSPANWILDSGAFSQISRFGRFIDTPESYAASISRWKMCGNLLAAVTQDFMCEPAMLKKTGLSVDDHQRLTVERYDALLGCHPGCEILPVLQGFYPTDYLAHLAMYGTRIRPGMWVGVGSVCKRNTTAGAVEDILHDIKRRRPDVRLHGFGLKTTALASERIRQLLFSADLMAWSFAARKQGRDGNDWREAERFRAAIATPRISAQMMFPVSIA